MPSPSRRLMPRFIGYRPGRQTPSRRDTGGRLRIPRRRLSSRRAAIRPWRPRPSPAAAAGRAGHSPAAIPRRSCRAAAPGRSASKIAWWKLWSKRSPFGSMRFSPWRSKAAKSSRSVAATPSSRLLRARILDLRLRHAVERAAQIVDRRQQILGEIADRVFLRVLALALGAAAHVLGLGQRPQQPVLGFGELGLERRQPLLGRRRRGALVGQFAVAAASPTSLAAPPALLCVLVLDHVLHPMSRPIILAV